MELQDSAYQKERRFYGGCHFLKRNLSSWTVCLNKYLLFESRPIRSTEKVCSNHRTTNCVRYHHVFSNFVFTTRHFMANYKSCCHAQVRSNLRHYLPQLPTYHRWRKFIGNGLFFNVAYNTPNLSFGYLSRAAHSPSICSLSRCVPLVLSVAFLRTKCIPRTAHRINERSLTAFQRPDRHRNVDSNICVQRSELISYWIRTRWS